MKKSIALLTVIVVVLMLSACVQTKNDIANYDHDVKEYYADLFMPDLDGIGEYKEIDYLSKHDNGIFPWDSMQLVVQYDEETFLKEKEFLNTAYSYLKEPKQYSDGDWIIPMAEFSAAGYDFRIAELEDTEYPKNFGMVGTSEETHKIIYLWLYAPDLDLICMADENEIKAMNEFVEYYFSLGG